MNPRKEKKTSKLFPTYFSHQRPSDITLSTISLHNNRYTYYRDCSSVIGLPSLVLHLSINTYIDIYNTHLYCVFVHSTKPTTLRPSSLYYILLCFCFTSNSTHCSSIYRPIVQQC